MGDPVSKLKIEMIEKITQKQPMASLHMRAYVYLHTFEQGPQHSFRVTLPCGTIMPAANEGCTCQNLAAISVRLNSLDNFSIESHSLNMPT